MLYYLVVVLVVCCVGGVVVGVVLCCGSCGGCGVIFFFWWLGGWGGIDASYFLDRLLFINTSPSFHKLRLTEMFHIKIREIITIEFLT